MAAKLIAEEGPLKGLILPLENGEEWVIGRDPDSCQLIIEDPAASRRHLVCRSTQQGISLENLSATNPVQINYEEIKQPRILNQGDIIKIGSGLFRFYEDPRAPEPEEKKPAPEEMMPEPEEPSSIDFSLPEETDKEPPRNFEEESYMPPSYGKTATPKREKIFSEKNLAQEERPLPPKKKVIHESIFEDDLPEKSLAEIDLNIDEMGRWLLKVISGPNTGAEFTMKSGVSYILGTDPSNCDVIFNDTSVSRQHARITISDKDILTIEDLKSRNGTLVDGKTLEGKLALQPNLVVNLGTSAFVIYDKEGEFHTIVSPLLPSIVKVLQKEERKESPKAEIKAAPVQPQSFSESNPELYTEVLKEKNRTNLTAFIFIAIITGSFVLIGIGIVTLFQTNPVQIEQNVDANKSIAEALAPFPSIEWIYNKATGSLLLVGHVLTDDVKRQLLYNLEGFNFIKNIDSRDIIIDERVWQDFNPNLARNPSWRGVTLQANTPGKFVLSGFLKTRAQMESLVEYMSRNFPYFDMLEYRVLVEEDVLAKIKQQLTEAGINGVKASMNNRVLVLQGVVPTKLREAYEKVIADLAKNPSLKNMQNYVVVVPEASSTQDITDRYLVTGVSRSGAAGNNMSVVIDGKILSKGDVLDGMLITEINPQAVILQKDGIHYKINLKP